MTRGAGMGRGNVADDAALCAAAKPISAHYTGFSYLSRRPGACCHVRCSLRARLRVHFAVPCLFERRTRTHTHTHTRTQNRQTPHYVHAQTRAKHWCSSILGNNINLSYYTYYCIHKHILGYTIDQYYDILRCFFLIICKSLYTPEP